MDITGPDTERRVAGYVQKYGITLIQELGFDPIAVWAFFFLFVRQTYAREPGAGSYDVYKYLKVHFETTLYENMTSVSEKNVGQSLIQLEYRGFIVRAKPPEPRPRRRGERKKAGRPPLSVYRTASLREIMARVGDAIESRRQKVMTVFNELADVDETFGMRFLEKGGDE